MVSVSHFEMTTSRAPAIGSVRVRLAAIRLSPADMGGATDDERKLVGVVRAVDGASENSVRVGETDSEHFRGTTDISRLDKVKRCPMAVVGRVDKANGFVLPPATLVGARHCVDSTGGGGM